MSGDLSDDGCVLSERESFVDVEIVHAEVNVLMPAMRLGVCDEIEGVLDMVAQKSSLQGRGDEGIVGTAEIDKIVPWFGAFQEKLHGVDGVEQHGDAAIGDELRFHEEDVFGVVTVMSEDRSFDTFKEMLLHFLIEMYGIYVAWVINASQEPREMVCSCLGDLYEKSDVCLTGGGGV